MMVQISPNRTAVIRNEKGLNFIKFQGFSDKIYKNQLHAIINIKHNNT